MKLDKTTLTLSIFGMLGVLATAGGCANETTADVTAPAAEQAAEASEAALGVERAERMLDRGQDAAAAKALLLDALAKEDLTPEERRQAVLALSRSHERLGDKEQAIAIIESELAANADNRDWPGEAFGERLRELLTDWPDAPRIKPQRDGDPVAPFAHVVARYFPPAADGKVWSVRLMAGGRDGASNELGTFNIGGAVRQQQEKDCPLCEKDVNIHESVGRSDWLMIPSRRSEFERVLAVFYFDLAENRIPARYEQLLPMKVADIVKELEMGKSFVVAKERPGAPPSILIAAPRAALLADVEAKLASLDELPTNKIYADVDIKLRKEEIQGTMRAQYFPDVRRCYEARVKEAPTAQGTVKVHYTVDADGAIKDARLESPDEASLGSATLDCISRALGKVRFPATGSTTTVTYPVTMTP